MRVEVALPLPVPHTFTYRVPAGAVAEGSRVLVPFRGRHLVGWVVGPGRDEGADATQVRDVRRVLDATPSIPADLLQLCRWISDYYIAPLGPVLRAALPVVLSSVERPEPPVRVRRIVRLRAELPSLLQRDEVFGRAKRQRECFEYLESVGGAAELSHLTERAGFAHAVVRGLVERDVAAWSDEAVERDPFAGEPVAPAPALTPTSAQSRALDELVAASRTDGGPGRPFLLRGVTGSGKTLVYIELLREIVERQRRGAIVLVPEIALTPQTVARFRAVFGDAVAVLHSALSDGERYDAWRALRRGDRRIAVGARSAVFAPVPDLGAIVVDEEHEATYKQSEAPRYHAREAAIMRARMAGAVCLLGSATPALESWHNAATGKFRLLELPDRVEGRPLPPVRLIDLRAGAAPKPDVQSRTPEPAGPRGRREPAAAPPPVLSPPLVDAIRDRLDRGEQTVLLLNRRGYATFVQCRECGTVRQCPHCNVSLTYHRGRRRMLCHYCFHEEEPPAACDACGSRELWYRGVGTEQVERTVVETFPAARIARMDVDTTSGKWAHHRILGRVERGEVDILLGTQMIAKGLDFPRVTLVGVINADVGMSLPDFRASERTFQLLTQVAGRAGRGPVGGEVLVQTALPEHYAIRAALDHDFAGYAERELDERRSPRYPPHCRLVNVGISGRDAPAVRDAAEELARWLYPRIEEGGRTVELLGPAPCAIDRIRGRWRWHLLLRSGHATALGAVARELRDEFRPPRRGELRIAIDRDPVSLL